MDTLDRFRGALLGLACGDAVGTTVEFRPRGRFVPLTDMVGGGSFALQRCAWQPACSMPAASTPPTRCGVIAAG
jgi:ADP-ribosyl-[dinitrogen reductase] hydrolase